MGFLRIKNDIGTILGLLLTTFFVVACSSNPKIVTMSSSVPEGLSTADVKAAVLEGCNGRGWACKDLGNNTIEGSIMGSRQALLEVNIIVSQGSFSVDYANSENLEYDAEENTIHRNYHNWVGNLSGDIMNALLLKAS